MARNPSCYRSGGRLVDQFGYDVGVQQHGHPSELTPKTVARAQAHGAAIPNLRRQSALNVSG